MDLSWIGRVAQAAASRPGTVVLMTDGAGTVLARYPEPQKWVGRSYLDHPLVTHMLLRTEGTVTESGLDGVRRVFGFVKLPDIETRFAVGLDEAAILRHVDTEETIAYVAVTAISVLPFAAVWFGGEWLIVRPIRVLARRRNVLAEARSACALATSRGLPSSRLAAAMDDMATTLAQREGQLRVSNGRLKALARPDGLTGLLNRRGFDADLQVEWRRAAKLQRPLALLMIDVDHFKLFNDTRGHLEGDDCLRAVARTLALAAKAANGDWGQAARYGGEEFVVLLPHATAAMATELAERIRVAIEDLNIPHPTVHTGRVTVSIGVAAVMPRDLAGAQALLNEADANVYAAKRLGRNKVVAPGPVGLLEAS